MTRRLPRRRQRRTLRYEKIWNRIREKQSNMLGEKWTYKHDRRDNWTLEKHDTKSGYKVRAEGEYPDPKTTIVWRRDTNYGKQREADIRKLVAGDSGYVAGHIVPASAGADPEGVNAGQATRDINGVRPQDRINYTRQNPEMNIKTGHRDTEIAIASRAAAGPPVKASYLVNINTKRSYPRETHRKFEVTDATTGERINVKGAGNKEFHSDKYVVANPSVDKGGPAHDESAKVPSYRDSEGEGPGNG